MNPSEIQMWDVNRPKPYALNAKIHDPAQVSKIASSIKQFGWRGNPIVVDENEEILAGHGRQKAAFELGLKHVPVQQMLDMTEEQKRAFRLADNRVAISNLDSDLLAQELATLDFSLEGIFDKKELEFMVADLGELSPTAFVADLDHEIAEQDRETAETIIAIADKPVAIAKALGFKTIKGADERDVAMFIAQLEADSGKTGADAFLHFVRNFKAAA